MGTRCSCDCCTKVEKSLTSISRDAEAELGDSPSCTLRSWLIKSGSNRFSNRAWYLEAMRDIPPPYIRYPCIAKPRKRGRPGKNEASSGLLAANLSHCLIHVVRVFPSVLSARTENASQPAGTIK